MILSIDRQRRTATVRLTGTLQAADLKDAFSAMVAHPDFEPGFNSLWDLRGASAARLDFEALRDVVRAAGAQKDARGPGKVAIVVTHDVDYGVSRIYEMLASGLPTVVNVFRSVGEAEAWFGRPLGEG
jgi:hypothetical protein